MAPVEDSFAFPPMHSFSPFFTIQPNSTTLAAQLSLWSSLILSWAQYHRVFSIDPDGQWERNGAGGLFKNSSIQRELSSEDIRTILAYMVKEGKADYELPRSKGHAAPSAKVLIFWRTPQEWGDLIFDWISETGQNGSITTFFELTDGDLVHGQEFAHLPIPMLRRALDALARTGRAQVFTSEAGSSQEGVKFS